LTNLTAARWTAISLAGVLLLAACGGSAATTPPPVGASAAPESMAAESMAPESMAPESMAAESMAPESTEPSANPAAAALASKPWATATLTDVATGETFTIADLAGKPIFIEAMAIWCSNCRAQQARFTEAFGKMLPGIASYVVVTVDPSETAEDLARYKAERGFTGSYAVAGKAVSTALEAEFGASVLNPSSVPLIFVSAAGEVSFSTGPESVEAILEAAGV
jgi:thiol-disulfide isomerase/thioredoxin